MPQPGGIVRSRGVQKIAKAVGQCSTEASAYGACIVADYNAVEKDKCRQEFMKLKDCYLADHLKQRAMKSAK